MSRSRPCRSHPWSPEDGQPAGSVSTIMAPKAYRTKRVSTEGRRAGAPVCTGFVTGKSSCAWGLSAATGRARCSPAPGPCPGVASPAASAGRAAHRVAAFPGAAAPWHRGRILGQGQPRTAPHQGRKNQRCLDSHVTTLFDRNAGFDIHHLRSRQPLGIALMWTGTRGTAVAQKNPACLRRTGCGRSVETARHRPGARVAGPPQASSAFTRFTYAAGSSGRPPSASSAWSNRMCARS